VPLFETSKRARRKAPPPPSAVPPTSLAPPPSAVPANGNGDHGIFDRPGGPFVTALSRHKLAIAICGVLFAVLGLAIGLSRSPTYTGSASLQVGQVNPNSPGFVGYTQSASSLAEVFSRAVYAEPVLNRIEAKLGLPATVAAERLSAEPIALSPVFRVIATGPSAEAAENLANVASEAVVDYVGRSNSANPQSAALLQEAHGAAVDLRRAEAKVNHLAAAGTGELFEAEAARNVAKLKLEAISKSYVETVATQAPRAGLVSLVAGATIAESDRHSMAQLYALIGFLVGLLAGGALALLLERRRQRSLPGPADAPAR
jgi:capsular polysaccharide biosynthesis protein